MPDLLDPMGLIFAALSLLACGDKSATQIGSSVSSAESRNTVAPVSKLSSAAPSASVRPSATAPSPCEAGCAALTACGADDPSCAATCGRHPGLSSCLASHDQSDCGGLASCMWNDFCGGPIKTGTASCKTAGLCQNACNEKDLGNTACLCGCLKDISPDAATILWNNDICAGTNCKSDCVPHGDNAACLRCFGMSCFMKQAKCLSN